MMTMRTWIGIVAATFLLAGVAIAAAPDFGRWDGDGNEYLDQAEIEGAAPEILKRYDRNGDGHLDRKEFKTAGGVESRFDLLDRNKNGLLDLDELKQSAAAHYKEFDTNRDGRINPPEWDVLRKPAGIPVINLFYF